MTLRSVILCFVWALTSPAAAQAPGTVELRSLLPRTQTGTTQIQYRLAEPGAEPRQWVERHIAQPNGLAVATFSAPGSGEQVVFADDAFVYQLDATGCTTSEEANAADRLRSSSAGPTGFLAANDEPVSRWLRSTTRRFSLSLVGAGEARPGGRFDHYRFDSRAPERETEMHWVADVWIDPESREVVESTGRVERLRNGHTQILLWNASRSDEATLMTLPGLCQRRIEAVPAPPRGSRVGSATGATVTYRVASVERAIEFYAEWLSSHGYEEAGNDMGMLGTLQGEPGRMSWVGPQRVVVETRRQGRAALVAITTEPLAR